MSRFLLFSPPIVFAGLLPAQNITAPGEFITELPGSWGV
jgi:hypothetical protein